jgi:hypothetical protein
VHGISSVRHYHHQKKKKKKKKKKKSNDKNGSTASKSANVHPAIFTVTIALTKSSTSTILQPAVTAPQHHLFIAISTKSR